ncbi:cation diffusion facilitator family transporter [Qingshengfaniella alkalisoli]|uniref:Cation diffusion facilitator family transporter n=1 Tax=Qingshengfaniella alkalisoli TaxID=2599296 RepID=A0A5B8IXL1_9RHOB|nr:cation diffusion facilitator family transporter [Qingshengfaniella alkalisoli]QDY69661.1 cation diffusion facilitator family transporter [Qingshengfaniella alkalisoli]
MIRPDTNHRLARSAGVASVLVALTLVSLKLWAFFATGSLAVAGSLVDSALDAIMSLLGLWAILYAAKPPDDDHAFGHNSAEDLAALAQALFLTVSACAIGLSAVRRLLSDNPTQLQAQGAGMVVMSVSITLTICLVLWQRYVGRKTGNKVVQADALHYLSDLLPNIAAIVALWASAHFGVGHIDSVIALMTAAILIHGARRIGKGAWDALMDRSADPDLVAKIEDIAGNWPGVDGYHDLKTRTSGARVFVNLHVEIDGSLSLYDAHEIGAGLRHAILEACPQADVIIHKDPA